jgi:HAE1 family hydrophobic/amphiphilic exporter-1
MVVIVAIVALVVTKHFILLPGLLLYPFLLGILLYLDFVVERFGKMPFKEALIDSARLRFHPIAMTTLTILVIAGPLMFGRGEGSEFGHRLGIVTFGGILISAVLTFFVVPRCLLLFRAQTGGKAVRARSSGGWAGG